MINTLATLYIAIAFVVFLAWCALVNNITKMADPEDATLGVIVATYFVGVIGSALWPILTLFLFLESVWWKCD